MSENKIQYLAYDIGIKMRKLMKKIEAVQTVLVDKEITRSEERIIFPIIKDERGHTIQELSDLGGVDKGLVSRTISRLEANGFVTRDKETATQDRNYKIILTSKGKEFIDNKNARVLEVLNKWFENIPLEFVQKFSEMLDTLLAQNGGAR